MEKNSHLLKVIKKNSSFCCEIKKKQQQSKHFNNQCDGANSEYVVAHGFVTDYFPITAQHKLVCFVFYYTDPKQTFGF